MEFKRVVPIFRIFSLEKAREFYLDFLGCKVEWEHRFEPGMPAFVSMARGRARVFLSEHQGDARPDTLLYLVVGDTDAVAREFGRPSGDQPYGCDFELRDPDGNRLRISSPAR